MAILGFIRVNPSPARQQTGSLQVRLDHAAPAELPARAPAPLSSPVSVPRPEPQVRAEPTAPPPMSEPSSIPHLDLPQLADTTYYDALALDVQPQAISAIALTDPEEGSPTPHVGHVKLELKLEADGQVSEAKVLESSLPSAYETIALEAFGKAKFSPGRRNGRAVRARIVIEVNFKPL